MFFTLLLVDKENILKYIVVLLIGVISKRDLGDNVFDCGPVGANTT